MYMYVAPIRPNGHYLTNSCMNEHGVNGKKNQRIPCGQNNESPVDKTMSPLCGQSNEHPL